MIRANRKNFLFEEVKQTAPERNGFDLSHENKQTCRAGKLYPFEILEALPNDDFEIQVEQFIRLSPMLSPTMHRVKSYWHWFFVPNRLCWSKWEEFISRGNGKKLPVDQEYTPPQPPTISMATLLEYGPQAQLFFVTPPTAFSGTLDELLVYLQNRHPELVFIKGPYSGSDQGIFIFVRTPRLANALHIPDTLFPIGWYDKGKNLHHVVASETEGEFTVNQLFQIAFASGEAQYDIYGYYHSVKLSLMPFIATFRIWLEYYRDENLDEDYSEMLDYFVNSYGEFLPTNDTLKQYCRRLFMLNYRCWEKDYFTTATQLPQKAPDVEIPGTGGSGDLTATTTIAAKTAGGVSTEPGSPTYYSNYPNTEANGVAVFDNGALFDETLTSPGVSHGHVTPLADIAAGLKAETSVSSSGGETLQPTTVAQVRRAFALQRWFEKVVRTGTRYIETLQAFFKSNAGDSRLQRAEYIGGMSTPIQISDVVQTSATDDNGDTPQGNLAGYGVASDTSQVVSYHCPEHGFILGFFSVLARTSYAQGIPKLFSRESWLDYAWPEFEHVGEQGIRQKELAAFPLSTRLLQVPFGTQLLDGYAHKGNDHIFGYQSRYSEYKQHPDIFGSGFSSSLDFWSLGRIFDYPPSLNADFVHAQVSDRNFAVVGNNIEGSQTAVIEATSQELDEAYDYDTYQCDFWLDIKKVTSLTLYSEPI